MTLRVLSTPLTGSSLARLATGGESTPWYVAVPRTTAEWAERASVMRSSLLQEDWLSQLAPALGQGATSERIVSAARSGFVVTSGQQPGLFGGPLYTWWKALSVLALADALQESTGMPVAPVFWAATDDSDFAESASTVVTTADGAVRISMTPRDTYGASLSEVPLGDLSRELEALELAAGSAPASVYLSAVRNAYAPSKTVGEAYVHLLRSILEPMGIAVLDAAHPAVRSAAHPLIIASLQRGELIESALAERDRAIESAGHASQVKLVEGRTLAFADRRGKRERVRIREAHDTAASAQPGSLGPNVLLRPVAERSILPTVACVGGPAEIAYFAQVTAVADALEVPPPLVVPRWSGFVVEPRVERILDRYGLDVDDFRDPHAVETALARSALPEPLVDHLAQLRETVARSTAQLAGIEGTDLVPPNVLQGLNRNIGRRIDRLERRFTAGVKKRGSDALRDAAIARGALFPFGVPQERALNIVPLLARYGEDLLNPVLAEVRAHAAVIA